MPQLIASDFFTGPAANPLQPIEQAPPDCAVAADGRIHTGVFTAPLSRFDFSRALALGGSLKNAVGFPRLVEWYGAGMAHPDYYFGLIVVQAQLASYATLYVFNRRSRRYFSHDAVGASGRAKISQSPWRGITTYDAPGFAIAIEHDLAAKQHRLTIDIAKRLGRPPVSGSLIWHEDIAQSPALAALVPMGGKSFIYNHKAQMPIAGRLRLGKATCEFSPQRDLANMDEVRASMGPGRHRYVWFNFSGFNPQGQIVGFNAATVGADNPALAQENVIWAGPSLTHVGAIDFDVDARDLMRPWRARDAHGRVNLTFTPEGGKKVHAGPWLRYDQKCGTFNGTLVDAGGRQHTIADYVGCAEFARVFR